MKTVKLYTTAGLHPTLEAAFVAEVLVPDFDVDVEVILWGSRIFVRKEIEGGIYREACGMWAVVTT